VEWLKVCALSSKLQSKNKKQFARPHLNQWLGLVVLACHPSKAGKHKYEDCGTGWLGHKWGVYGEMGIRGEGKGKGY
jgi:hypothetical protein